jgi:hypothetical protein
MEYRLWNCLAKVGVSYSTAWKMKHKLMQVMLERDSAKPISGRIEIDDSYPGAKTGPGCHR